MAAVGKVIHADWSIHPRKRWSASATLRRNGSFVVDSISRFKMAPDEIIAAGKDDGLLVGFDFPIGFPRAYATAIGLTDFRDFLKWLGDDARFASFAAPAARPEDVSFFRPFYPAGRGKGAKRAYLLFGLGVSTWGDLLRECERKTDLRPEAGCLFLTIGGKQVGRAASSGWLEILAPLARSGAARFWPFDGHLHDLAAMRGVTVVETYPAEAMRQLQISSGKLFSKTNRQHRVAVSARIVAAADELNLELSDDVAAQVADGFGSDREGEDRFDALVGLLGMIAVLTGVRSEGTPASSEITSVEGWILGQAAPVESFAAS